MPLDPKPSYIVGEIKKAIRREILPSGQDDRESVIIRGKGRAA
jgi:hypothetical protein